MSREPEDPYGYFGAYASVQDRLANLVTDAGAERAVPACPGWHVREIVAHLVGLCQDWVNGSFDGYASNEWTAEHLRRFAGWNVEALFVEWSRTVVRFGELVDSPFGGPPARWAFGDALIHEADVRGALGVERVPTEALVLGMRGSLARWHEVLERAHAPGVRVLSPEGQWRVGPSDDPDPVAVEVPCHEIFRALAGRRTKDQVLEWRWSRDARVVVEAGLPYPFSWASSVIVD